MMLFTYKAADPDGNIHTGSQEAPNEDGVVAMLHAQGWTPIRVGPAAAAATVLPVKAKASWRLLSRRLSSADILRFTQDLATLLLAGLPLDRALNVMSDATDKSAMQKTLRAIIQDVKEGSYLSEALARHPKLFSDFYVNMVKSGEAGGVIEHVLERLGQFLETTQKLKDYVVSAMIYPLFVLSIGGASIIILLTFVVPKFAIIFADMGQTIPLATRTLLAFSHLLRSYGVPLLGLLLAGLIAVRRYAATPAGRLVFDRWRLQWPILRTLTRTLETARFTRTLGTLIGSGVPILDALAMSRDIVSNRVIAQALDRIHERVKEGEPLAGPLTDSKLFPRLATQMILVGEETGQLDPMLLKVGELYDRKVRDYVKKLINLLEPGMILAMGLVVGFIVIAMLSAIFSMNELPF